LNTYLTDEMWTKITDKKIWMKTKILEKIRDFGRMKNDILDNFLCVK